LQDIENSVWETVVESLNSSNSSLDVPNIESVFGHQKKVLTKRHTLSDKILTDLTKKEPENAGSLKFLDTQMNLGLSVVLRSFRLPVIETARYIRECCSGNLDLDALRNLFKVLPDQEKVILVAVAL